MSEDPLPFSACELFLEMLRVAHGPSLLRVKGVIALADDLSRPLVIHGVQHIFHPPVRLDPGPMPIVGPGSFSLSKIWIRISSKDFMRRLLDKSPSTAGCAGAGR